ncbi:GrpB family protein [Streptomyces sp. NBC_00053]|uniref:GrpB family protein n=1 Tax=unclassified Streptomyces TaxID=2593676 RepID=UPI00224E7C16|nr:MULTISPECIES: GrpB family protein [unclassified Streptomyces]MCX5165090.1 GrpB family protein [Streptomyces sp. NBC_00305]MCX5223613.1 GrpB family protein [Streptomyces sp. NBC_00264]MCX5505199.1 GrpB family protein [Streptomyces sp. NBC_00052]MCX5546264.1 GrpB family protein [Streptomyces sp. NBC_00051]
MPFADEVAPVAVLEYQPRWPVDFERPAGGLYNALGSEAHAIDHIGSTSVPGLAAKDWVDIQVRVAAIQEARQVGLLAAIGFRCRPEPWNRAEVSAGQECRKLVFAPPAGARRCNVHLRREGDPNCRYALLFRDYLRADEAARQQWGAFKRRLAHSVPDLLDNGQIKAPATEILMIAAERWAAATGWQLPPGSPAPHAFPVM